MKMFQNFKNPEEASDSDSLDELIEGEDELGMPVVIAANDSDATLSDVDLDPLYDVSNDDDDVNDDSDFDPNEHDSDDSMKDSDKEERIEKGKFAITGDVAYQNSGTGEEASGSLSRRCNLELNIEEEDDETVRAIIAAIKKPRTSPPEIKMDDFITNICFHPERDIIALGTITGDVSLYKYSNEENTLLRNIEIHAKSCRDVEFTDDGRNLLTCSKDKSIMVTDMETEKLKKFYETAHDEAINKLLVIDECLFASGDDAGTVKLWDLRTKEAIFELKEVEDYISQMLTNDGKKLLLVVSGDGYLTTINLGARKLYVQSEPYEEELTCMGVYRGDSKLVVGTSKGRLYTYNWGQFGYHCDMFPAIKSSINEMIPVTDRIGCIAGEEGIIRACHIAPFRILGIVGQHSMPIESLDINNTGELIASSSHNNDVRFWNVKYFEEFGDIKYNDKHNTFKESRHNLPSSKFSNASDFFADLAKEPNDNA